MTLREVVSNAFGTNNLEPDQKTIDKNLETIEKLKKGEDSSKQQDLEAIAAELKAHKQAAAVRKATQEVISKKNDTIERAQVANNGTTAQDTKNGKTAQV